MLHRGMQGRGVCTSLNTGFCGKNSLAILLLGVLSSIAPPAAWAATPAVGTMAGEFSVDLSGSATYQIPLDLPSGVHGLKPKLSMSYSSSGGPGLLGNGWSLTGISIISRCAQTLDQDGITSQPSFSSSDRFCLDGQRLVMTSGNGYGATSSVYHTEIETFQKVTAGAPVSQGSCGANSGLGSGPATFTVHDRSGLTSTYGDTTDSTLTGDGYTFLQSTGTVICQNPSRVAWPITRVTDKYGNFISFQYYDLQTGDAWNPANFYIKEIDYGSSSRTVARVVFSYDTGQSLDLNSYFQYVDQTFSEANPALLKTIQVLNNTGVVLRAYTLGYSTINEVGDPVHAHPAELTSIQECGSDASCFNPTIFAYQGVPHDFVSNPPTKLSAGTMPYRQILDLDGDGLPDYIYCLGSGCAKSDGELYVVFGNHANGAGIDTGVGLAFSNFNVVYQNAVVVSVNGDAKQQLLVPYCSQTTSECYWKELSWSGSYTGTPMSFSDPPVAGSATNMVVSNTGYGNALAIDLTGSGRSDLVITDNGSLYYYRNSSSGFTATATKAPYVAINGTSPRMYQVNYSGTGFPEIYIVGSGVVQAQLSANNPGTVPNVTGFTQFGGTVFSDDGNLIAMFPINANGDGLSGIVRVTYSGDPSNPGGGKWYFYPNNGSGWDTNPQYVVDYSQFDTSGVADAQSVDWYGDGRQELIVPSGATWHLLTFGQGPVYGENGVAPVYARNLGITVLDGGSTVFIDADADGEFDMLYTSGSTYYIKNAASPYVMSKVTNGLGLNTYIGYVTPALAQYTSVITGSSSSAVSPPRILPYTGFMQVVRDFAADTGLFNSNGTAQQLYTYYKYGAPVVDTWGRGLLGYSEVETVNYNTGIYSLTFYDQTFPYQGIALQSYKYWNPSINSPQPTEIQGSVTTKCFREDGTGLPDCESTAPKYEPAQFDSGGTLLTHTVTTLETDPSLTQPYAGVYLPLTKTVTVYKNEPATNNQYETVKTTYDYAQVGTTTPIGIDIAQQTVTTTITDTGDASDVATVVSKYSYDAEGSCPGNATVVTVTNTFKGSSQQTYPDITENLVYNSNCFLTKDTKTIVAPPGVSVTGYPMTLEKDYVPDTYGNTQKTTLTDGAQAGRSTTVAYDDSHRFPVAITNPLGQPEGISYDDFGKTLSDIDANGNEIDNTYDGFERLTYQTGPEPGVHVTRTYSSTCSANCISGGVVAYTVNEVSSDKSSATTQFDELARPIRVVKAGFNGTTVYQDTAYDLLGRVSASSKPYLSTAANTSCWDSNTYDVLDRLTEKDQAVNQSVCTGPGSSYNNSYRKTKISYDGLTTKTTVQTDIITNTNATGEVTTTVNNVLGKPVTVTDNTGVNKNVYSYDPWGNAISVTPPNGNTVSMSYDSAGNKLSMRDPDMGFWIYSYDAFGELKSQTDSKYQTTGFVYDLLGRLIERDEPEGGSSTWKYDIAYGAGIGRLAYKVAPNGVWEGYAYDVYGHATDKITVINGQEYWITSTYDSQGRVSQVLYPDLNGISVSGTPAAPSGFSVTEDPDNNADFNVNWTNVQNGAIYHLYRNASSTAQVQPANEIYSGPDAGFYDDGITDNGTYTWSLEACNGTNCSAPVSQTLTITLPWTVPGTPVPPSPDSHLRTNTLTWAASSQVSTTAGPIAYVVQETKPDGSAVQFTATDPANAATSVTLSSDGQYSFMVRSLASSAYSAWSGSTTYSTVLTPGAPGSITAPASQTPSTSPATYTVSWTAPGFSGGLVTYVLQEENQLDSNPAFTTIYSGTALSKSVSHNVDGLYLYRVKACDQADATVCGGFNQATAPTAVTLPPTPPGVPVLPNADLNTVSWTATWTASSVSSMGSPSSFITYTLQQAYNGGAFADVTGGVTVSGNTVTGYPSANLVGGYYQDGTYTYQVKACNHDPATGGLACSQYVAATASYATTITPGVPNSITVPGTSNIDGSFTVTYTAPPSGSGGTVSKYTVQLGIYDGEIGAVDWSYGDCNSTTLSCTFSGNTVIQSGLYKVQVLACGPNAVCSNGLVASNRVNVNNPAPPTLSGPSSTSSGGVALSWTTVTGATSYQLYTATKPASTDVWGGYSQTYSGTATSRSVFIGVPYEAARYYVLACDSVACTSSSNVVTVTSASVLSGPASTSTGNVALSWTAISSAANYKLYYSWEVSGGTYSAWAVRTTITGTSYTDSVALTHANTRYYIIACNSNGCGGNSNVITVTYNTGGGGAGGCPPPPQQCQLVMPDDRWGANSGQPLVDPDSDASPVNAGGADVTPPQSNEAGFLATHVERSGAVMASAIPGGSSTSMRINVHVAEGSLPAQGRAIPSSAIARLALPEHKLHLKTLKPVALVAGITAAELPELIAATGDGEPDAPAPVTSGSSHMTYYLTHTGRTTYPVEDSKVAAVNKVPAAAEERVAAWPPKPLDSKLSEYPPLRKDIRVAEHFESEGGMLPAQVQSASASTSKPTATAALMVKYVYGDPAGYLTAVKKLNLDGSLAGYLWVPVEMTPYGQFDKAVYDAPSVGSAGTLEVDDSYDAATGMLSGLQVTAGVSNQTVVAQYDWDGYGNLKDRTLTQNGQNVLNETFAYDSLNRLVTFGGASGNCLNGKTVCYDAEGGFIGNGGYTNYQYTNPGYTVGNSVGSYTYNQPHAVSSVTLPDRATVRAYTYDADGNLYQVMEDGVLTRQVDWTTFNKPQKIQNFVSGKSSCEILMYSADHDRVMTTTNQGACGSSAADTTIYIDGLFESEYSGTSQTQTYRHYIVVSGARVAVETITANNVGQQQNDQLGFFIHDQIGSVIGQVTENLGGGGQQLALYSYDAWGKERSTAIVGGLSTFTDLSTNQFAATITGQHEGFAGHENEPAVGLVEMEGRVYDPEVGRFLSADPDVQFPFSTQGYNRYTYVNDNPLTLYDPSGYDLFGGVGQDLIDIGTIPYYQTRDVKYWIYRRINPQEFAVLNMISSYFCGPFAPLCSAADTYQFERANGLPADEAIRAGVASGIETYATSESGNFEAAGFKNASLADFAEGAAIAYAGGYAASYVEGGNASRGGRRGLMQYGLKVAMDGLSGNNLSMDPAKQGAVTKIPNSGVKCATCSNTATEIDAGCTTDGKCIGGDRSLDELANNQSSMAILQKIQGNAGKIVGQPGNLHFAWWTEGGWFMQRLSEYVPGVNAFSIFHDQLFKYVDNPIIIGLTIPHLGIIPTYAAMGGYTQYHLVTDVQNIH